MSQSYYFIMTYGIGSRNTTNVQYLNGLGMVEHHSPHFLADTIIIVMSAPHGPRTAAAALRAQYLQYCMQYMYAVRGRARAVASAHTLAFCSFLVIHKTNYDNYHGKCIINIMIS